MSAERERTNSSAEDKPQDIPPFNFFWPEMPFKKEIFQLKPDEREMSVEGYLMCCLGVQGLTQKQHTEE